MLSKQNNKRYRIKIKFDKAITSEKAEELYQNKIIKRINIDTKFEYPKIEDGQKLNFETNPSNWDIEINFDDYKCMIGEVHFPIKKTSESIQMDFIYNKLKQSRDDLLFAFWSQQFNRITPNIFDRFRKTLTKIYDQASAEVRIFRTKNVNN